jgi:hypothetical protein
MGNDFDYHFQNHFRGKHALLIEKPEARSHLKCSLKNQRKYLKYHENAKW